MPKKITLLELKERLNKINPNIKVLSKEYLNSATKLLCVCKVCNYEWKINWNNLSVGKGCPKCAGNVALSIEEIKYRLQKINPNISILSNKYKNNSSKLDCECKVCNYKWYTTWGNLNNGCGCPKCGDSITMTLEEVKYKIYKINPNILVLSDKYINATTKILCKCLIDGYEWEVIWNSLQRGTGCPKCSGNLPDTIEEIKNKMKSINPNIKILSNEYIKNSVKLHCKCLLDEFEWYANWNHLRNGTGCPKCGKRSMAEKEKLTLSEVKNKLNKINPNIEILSNQYINNKTKLKCKCKIHNYEWKAPWSNLSQGLGCYICGIESIKDKQLLSLDEVKNRLKIINPNIEILSTEYKGSNSRSKLSCRCLIDNNIWETSWSSLSQGSGCPICGIRKNSGKTHYKYNPNITDIERENNRKILNENLGTWRKNVFERDKYTCQCCRDNRGGNLNAHHIDSYDCNREHRVDVNNGITLCKTCHKEFHMQYGYGKNTKEQFEEWISNKILNNVI